jgi:hypothetical protein
VEYASKLVAPQKTIALNPKPIAWWDHRCEGLLEANAKEVIPYVADGAEDRLSLALSDAVPIYLDTSHLKNEDMQVVMSIRQRFSMVRLSESLFKVDWNTVKLSAPLPKP